MYTIGYHNHIINIKQRHGITVYSMKCERKEARKDLYSAQLGSTGPP